MENKTRVLVVEDDSDYQEYYKNWLSDKKYLVKISGTFKGAEQILETHYFDVVIADMNLEGDERGGIKVLQAIEGMGDSTRRIVVSADPAAVNVRDSVEKFEASVLFKTELDKESLIRAVDQAVQKVPARRFGERSLYKTLLKDKGLADKEIHRISKNEIDLKDLLENTLTEVWPFNINLPITTKLVEVLKSEPVIQIYGWSRAIASAVVVRLGSQKIIERESHAYTKDIRKTLKVLKEGPFYHKKLGGIVYVLPDTHFEPVRDFAYFYENESDSRVVQAVEEIFRKAEMLYKSRGIDKVKIDLSLVYKHVLEPANYPKPSADRASVPEETRADPIQFLLKRNFIFENVPVGVVHGDLNSSNIIVNAEAQAQLLGFYVTGDDDESDVIVSKADKNKSDSVAFRARQVGKRNLLHDYATLEVSIRRTLGNINPKDIKEFDQVLYIPRSLEDAYHSQANFANPQLDKAYKVIVEVRKQASNLVIFEQDMQLYYSELLFQFLGIYLRLETPEKESIWYTIENLTERLSDWH